MVGYASDQSLDSLSRLGADANPPYNALIARSWLPWRIKNYFGTSILPTGMDLVGVNPVLNHIPVGKGKESAVRLELLKRQCPIGEYFLSDPDFTMIAVRGGH